MKLLTYKLPGEEKERLGVMSSSEFERFFPLEELGLQFQDMNDLIARVSPEEMELMKKASCGLQGKTLNYKDVMHCAPIPHPHQDIICLGLNFMDHAEESTRYKKEVFQRERTYAVYFSKRVNEAIGDGAKIPSYPGLVDSLDYEAELGVVLGKDAFQVKREDAFDYVFGYTVLNDVSARNIQTRHKQWYFGKSLDGFTPMGPFLVTEDDMKRPPILTIKSRVNGVLRQNGRTDQFIFDIPHVIEELSSGMTLKAGTIISMGTPAGVGMGMMPPRFLSPGDVVECGVEGIGMITNQVV
nr:fumarylacetoacetate hydrolase family protein [uncultured Blautia sp.]